MSDNFRGISVKILNKEYQITCPEGKDSELIDAACVLDKKMREIKSSGRVFGLERIAVMAALNLSYELQQQKKKLERYVNNNNKHLQHMNEKLENALTHNLEAAKDKEHECIIETTSEISLEETFI